MQCFVQHIPCRCRNLPHDIGSKRHVLKGKRPVLCGYGHKQGGFPSKFLRACRKQADGGIFQRLVLRVYLDPLNPATEQLVVNGFPVLHMDAHKCRILPLIGKLHRVFLIGEDIMLVGAYLFHIVAAKRQVACEKCHAVRVAEHNLNQPVCRDDVTVGSSQVLRRIQPKGYVLDLSFISDAKGFVLLQCFCKVNRHFLAFIVKGGVGFRHGDFLPRIDKLDFVSLDVQHTSIRRSHFHNPVFP